MRWGLGASFGSRLLGQMRFVGIRAELSFVCFLRSFCSCFGTFTDEDRHLATGDYAGGLAIWDLENLKKPVWSWRPRVDYAGHMAFAWVEPVEYFRLLLRHVHSDKLTAYI